MLQVGGELDLGQEPLGADHGGELGAQELERDLAVVPEVLGEIDGGHAAGADLAFDPVAVGERYLEAVLRARACGAFRWGWPKMREKGPRGQRGRVEGTSLLKLSDLIFRQAAYLRSA